MRAIVSDCLSKPQHDAPSDATAGPPRSLRTNFLWTALGNTAYAASQWGTLVVLAKVGTPEAVGQFALGLAISAPIITLANLNLRAVLATDAGTSFPFSDYLTLRVLTTFMAFAVTAAVGVFGSYPAATRATVLCFGATKGLEAISDIHYGRLQQGERMDRIAKSLILRGSGSFALFALVLLWTKTVWCGVAAMAVVWLAVLVSYDVRSGGTASTAEADGGSQGLALLRTSLRWNGPALRRLTAISLPLGIMMALGSLNANIPRYSIDRYLGTRELGFFAALAYLMVAGNTIVAALGQAASPRLAKLFVAGNRRAFVTLLTRLLCVAAGVGGMMILVVAFLGDRILALLYRPEYASYGSELLQLAVVATVTYLASFLGYGMTAVHAFRVQPVIGGGSLLVLLTASVALVPQRGLIGAIWAMGLAMVFQAAASLWVLSRVLGAGTSRGVCVGARLWK